MHDYLIVIPARLGSTRLPRKPLADINGKPMLQHTVERALEVAPREQVFIATDSEEVRDLCQGFQVQVEMTSSACLTGTDRVAEFATRHPAQIYVNLQGDEPFMPAENIRMIVEAGLAHPTEVVNGWSWIDKEEDWRSRNVPKVIIREDGTLMYMSRAPIPGNKSDTFEFARRQVCVYSFPAKALKDFIAKPRKTEHEAIEDIEILRFVEMGFQVRMIELEGGFISVDTPEDLRLVRTESVV
ncbi:MAG: 3-deoxy-manno-octulosonate cytidylyltransferase [Henriciella sp.]